MKMTTNLQTKQSASMLTTDGNRQSLSAGQRASTKTDQLTAQSASQSATRTAASTRSLPSTSKSSSSEETELLTGMLWTIVKTLKEQGGLLTQKRLPLTGEMVLVISPRLELLMRQSDEL